MLESVVDAYPDAKIDVYVVWVPMLASDNAQAADEISGMFTDQRVHQYWDPQRRVGTELAEKVYPGYPKDAAESLDRSVPADHWWRQSDQTWGQAESRAAPLWDIVWFYRPGDVWSESPPAPATMVKQLAFYGGSDDGVSGTFFRDFKKPPRESDWIIELRDAMRDFMRVGGAATGAG